MLRQMNKAQQQKQVAMVPIIPANVRVLIKICRHST